MISGQHKSHSKLCCSAKKRNDSESMIADGKKILRYNISKRKNGGLDNALLSLGVYNVICSI